MRPPLLLLILQASTGVELEEDNVAVGHNVFTSLLSVLSSGLDEGEEEETALKQIHVSASPSQLNAHKLMETVR